MFLRRNRRGHADTPVIFFVLAVLGLTTSLAIRWLFSVEHGPRGFPPPCWGSPSRSSSD